MNDRGISSRPALVAVAFFALMACASWGNAQTCTVSAVPLDFGIYIPTAATTMDTTIDVGCAALAVKIDAGGGGSFTPRTMFSAAEASLGYNLYTDAGHAQVWGDGSGSTVTVPTSGPATLTVYGKIPAGEVVDPGSYTDLVVVTVEF